MMSTKHILVAVFVLSLGGAIMWAITHPPTPEEIGAAQQRQAAQAQQAQRQRDDQEARAARIRLLCTQQQMCTRYKNAIEHCTPGASNFDACMKIMMPGEAYLAGMACRGDGSLINPPADMPYQWVCVLNGYP
jgi:hypothetical protein